MDDDAGAMSAWYIFTASGFSPACVGWPIYYLNVPLFERVTYQLPKGKSFNIEVKNFGTTNKYIKQVILNGKILNRNYITQDDINAGGMLSIVASDKPVKEWQPEKWISSFN
jgi:putative alpha-1,2-mannosidase